jgi:hypothetical protein
MKVYGIRAKGPMVWFDEVGTIYSAKLYRRPPTHEQMEKFRIKLKSPESEVRGMGDLIPEQAKLTVVEFELED